MASEVRVLITAVDNASAKLDGVQKASIGLSTAMAAGGVVATKMAIDFESSFAGVRKTVDATEAEFAALATGLRGMAREIPVNVNELNRITEAAGQLGIKKENILGFTRVMADLGVATNLSGDQAATALSRLANITQMNQKDFDKLGSTVVALGNNFATTESEIVEMGLRIAGAGSQIGLTEPQILGFAAALSSVGIEAQAGGSAISKAMIDIAQNVATAGDSLPLLAEVAGMTVDEFSRLFKQDAASAVNEFILGLGRIQSEGGNTFQVLEDLGYTEVRLRDALLRASGAGDLLSESLKVGSEAWTENNALTNEAEQRYKTAASQIAIAKNNLQDMGITIGSRVLPVVGGLAEGVTKATDAFGALPSSTQNIVLLGSAAAAALPLVQLGVAKATTAIKEMNAAMHAGKLNATGFALGLTALAIGADALLKKSTGEGLITHIMGNAEQNQRNKQAMGEVKDILDAFPDTATRVTKLTEALLANAKTYPELEKSAREALESNGQLREETYKASGAWKQAEADVKALAGAMKENGATTAELMAVYDELPPKLQEIFDAQTNVVAVYALQVKESERLEEATIKDLKAQRDLTDATKAGAPEMVAMGEAMGDAALSAEDLAAAIDYVAQSFSELNPATMALRVEHALLSEELEDIKDKGDAATAAEKERAKVITEQLIPALDAQIKKSDDNQKAVEGITDAVKAAIGPDALPKLKRVMDEVGRSHEDQIDVMGLLARAYDDVRTGNIPALMGKLDELKKILGPVEWEALALNSGNAIGKGFQQGVYNQTEPSKAAAEAMMDAAIAQAEMAAYPGGFAVGQSMGAGVGAGIAGATAAVIAEAESIVRSAINAMKNAAQTNSPSKVTHDEVGLPMAQGIATGILAGQKEISAAAESVVNAAAGAMKDNPWAPSSATLGAGAAGSTPKGAYNQNLVWDASQLGGRGAWVLPQDVGSRTGGSMLDYRSPTQQAFDLYTSGDLPYEQYAAHFQQQGSQPIINIDTYYAGTSDGDMVGGDLLYALGKAGIA